MKVHLEDKVRLDSNYSHLGKPSWCIEEIDTNGRVVSGYRPWGRSTFFTISNLQVVRTLSISNLEKTDSVVSSVLVVQGDAHSGFCNDGEKLEREIHYSMLGTSRLIKHFNVYIEGIEEENFIEYCNIWGAPKQESEFDFKKEISEDIVQISVYLKKSRLEEIAKTIESGNLASASLSMFGVPGFYSFETPFDQPYQIKILTENHNLISEEVPLRICDGRVGEFKLHLSSNFPLNIKRNFSPIDFQGAFNSSGMAEKDETVLEESHAKWLRESEAIKTQNIYIGLLNSIKLPLWLTFIALVLLILK